MISSVRSLDESDKETASESCSVMGGGRRDDWRDAAEATAAACWICSDGDERALCNICGVPMRGESGGFDEFWVRAVTVLLAESLLLVVE